VKYRPLGKTGIQTSALAFGALRLPMKEGHVKMDEAVGAIRRAFELGVNLIDSGVGYCHHESEITVGNALDGFTERVAVSTKNNYHGDDPGEWRAFLDQSIKRMRVDRIDIYNFHRMRPETFSRWKSLERSPLDEMRDAMTRPRT
jgi:aryl-alcohol dehydrogenase-like predicted oxidoreductase